MFAKIENVRVVAGNTLVDYWERDMTVVTLSDTDGNPMGAYIASGYMSAAWGAMIGKAVPVRVTNCDADSRLQWLHFDDRG